MPITVALVLVVVLAVAVAALLDRYSGGRVLLSGVEYAVVGVGLGGLGLGLLDARIIDTLQPFVSVTLGLVGFSLGLALRERLTGVPGLGAGFLTAATVLVGVAAAYIGVFSIPPLTGHSLARDPLWLALTMGSAASAVSTHVVDAAVRASKSEGPRTELLRAFALAGSLTAVVVSGGALAIRRAGLASNRIALTEVEWAVALVGLSVACGLMFVLFVGRRTEESDDKVFLATVGVVVFASGMGVAAGMSPLLIAMIAGVVVSLSLSDAGALRRRLERLERPSILVLLLFAGAMWRPVGGYLWLLPAIYLAARIVILRLATALYVRSFEELPPVSRLGDGLLVQGGMAAAVAVNHAQYYSGESAVVITSVLTASLLTDLTATGPLRRFLVDTGEVPPRLPKAPTRDRKTEE